MASLKELKGRINSVKSTQKITKAKQMVAAAKLRKAQASAEAARPYAARFAKIMASLASKVAGHEGAPRLLAGTGKDAVHLLVVANSDKGLCGAFNANIVKAALVQARELEAAGKTVLFYLIGRKGRAVIRRAYPKAILASFDTTLVREPGFAEASAVAGELAALYDAGKFDVAHLFYARFRSALVQEPTHQQIIPVKPPESRFSDGSSGLNSIRIADARKTLSTPFEDAIIDLLHDEKLERKEAERRVSIARDEAREILEELLPISCDYEPEEDEILADLLPRYLKTQLFGALLENQASEQGASMTAMDNATRNAGELIQKLTIQYNRSRQAAITTELIEIIAGAEAL